tara:strand:+ start:177944 stop:178897 length:954 start_codon:yes stop_codon:yes gene_type:complete
LEVSWLFNADYESFLFSGKEHYKQSSNKINQEFEYLIHFFEDEPIFTNKKYSKAFIDHIQGLTGREFKTTSFNKNVHNWWCEVGDLERDQALQSKITSTKFSIENGLETEAKILDDPNTRFEEGKIYKLPGEFSGRGHLKYPKDGKKIKRILSSGLKLIEEPLRNRTVDFSSLVLSEKEVITYENLVDEKFQYKGTKLAPFKVPEGYEKIISMTIDFYLGLGANYPFSIDSYQYRDGDELKLAPVCEVNVRKTMGFIAYRLKSFFKSPYGALLILSDRKAEGRHYTWLSPEENLFQLCFVSADSESQLNSLVTTILE